VVAAAAGVVVAVVTAGVAVAVAAAGVVLGAAAVALGDVFAFAAGTFLSFRVSADGCFLGATVALAAGCSVEGFVSGAAGAGFLVGGPFLSGFGGAGGSFAAGSFTGGASVFGPWGAAGSFAAGSFTGGASVFGPRGGFTSAGGFFSDCFFPGDCDSSGVGC
jgi:hypothetical protein